jgi:hypothetical protein
MKRAHLTLGVSLFAGLLLAGITHADAPTTRPADPNELAKLRRTVAELRDQNIVLQKTILELERQLILVNAPQLNPGAQPFKFNVPPNKAPLATPPGAVPHLFNGTTYYTIQVNAPQP